MKKIKCTLLKIAFFIMAINLNSNVFANNLPVKKSTVKYPVDREAAKDLFQSRLSAGTIASDINVDEITFLEKVASNMEIMTGKEFSAGVIKGMLISKKAYLKQIDAKELFNSFVQGGALYDFDMSSTNAGKMVWCLMIVFEGNEYPMIKAEGTYGICLNPVRYKKTKQPDKPIKPEVTWTLSGKTRCNNGVSEIEKISSDGQSVWVPGGNACPPPCDPSKAKIIETMVHMDTTWYKWQNDCGDIKYTYDAKPKITKVDGPIPCNCPKTVDVVKPKKVYNRYPGFVPQAPYLQQNGMVYVNNQQQRVVYQNIPSPNLGGPVEGNPGQGNPGGGNPTGGNPGSGNPWTGNPNPTGGNPGNNYIYVNGQWIPSSGNPGYYTNPFGGNTNGNSGYYLNGVWVPTGGNPAGNANGGNPVGG